MNLSAGELFSKRFDGIAAFDSYLPHAGESDTVYNAVAYPIIPRPKRYPSKERPMSHRIFNFSAGPAMLPTEVLEKSAQALLDYQGKGFGIAEVSHRGKEFDAVADETIARCKQLLGLGDSHDVLFMQGGATMLFTVIPINLLHGSADYL